MLEVVVKVLLAWVGLSLILAAAWARIGAEMKRARQAPPPRHAYRPEEPPMHTHRRVS